MHKSALIAAALGARRTPYAGSHVRLAALQDILASSPWPTHRPETFQLACRPLIVQTAVGVPV